MKVEIAHIERNEIIDEKMKQKVWYELTLSELKYHSGFTVNLSLTEKELALLKNEINKQII